MLAEPHAEELDAGPRKVAPGTERFCAVTGQAMPVAEMIRFVLGPDGAPVPDLKRKLPGRGIWITGTRDALRTAISRNTFARSFKRPVEAPKSLVVTTERLLERAALDALAIAHKSGKVILGFTRVEAAIAGEPIVALIHAADAAPDGVRKLNAALRRDRGENGEDIANCDVFTSAQLDLALGRANVIHAALVAGPESQTFLARMARLDRFRAGGTNVRRGTPETARIGPG
jgi:predicted RNA-binding protein YlxR (DUF448 family)